MKEFILQRWLADVKNNNICRLILPRADPHSATEKRKDAMMQCNPSKYES